MLRIAVVVGVLAVVAQCRAAAGSLLPFKDNCRPKPNGCECDIKWGTEVETKSFTTDSECRKSVEQQTAEQKKKLNQEIQDKFGDFKDNCFPKPSGGCKCEVNLGQTGGQSSIVEFDDLARCKKSTESITAENKKNLNAEIKEKFGNFRENCFPRPNDGCRCVEKDADGNEKYVTHSNSAACKILVPHNSRVRREARERVAQQNTGVIQGRQSPAKDQQQPNYDVRDPVRERAQQNYAKVLDELNEKFRGLREGCYPRPKGCLCVIGKNEQTQVNKRFMTDYECKCKSGERGCPV